MRDNRSEDSSSIVEVYDYQLEPPGLEKSRVPMNQQTPTVLPGRVLSVPLLVMYPRGTESQPFGIYTRTLQVPSNRGKGSQIKGI